MSLADEFRIVLRGLTQRKIRSWLTVFGVVIGIAAIVALISVSSSLESSIKDQFELFGTDKINIFPSSGGFDSFLNQKDLKTVKQIKEFELVSAMFFKSSQAKFKDQKVNIFVTGIEPENAPQIFEEINIGFAEGATFNSDSNKIILGPRLANDLYETKVLLGDKIEIMNKSFRVVGVLESLGNPQDDSNAYIPLGTMRALFNDQESISYILAKIKKGNDLNQVAEKTEDALRQVRNEDSFWVSTPDQLIENLNDTLAILQAVLVGIATISILVGSVGIASSMYTSVLERVKDIGIMKALGAESAVIIRIFLIEAAVLGFVGGALGVIAGFGAAKLVEALAAQAGFTLLKIKIQPLLAVFGIVFAMGVGAVSGFFPAKKASNLKPVDALKK